MLFLKAFDNKSINVKNLLIQIPFVGAALALHIVRVSALLVHDAHQFHPWIVLGAMASHAATLPHGHLGGLAVAMAAYPKRATCLET